MICVQAPHFQEATVLVETSCLKEQTPCLLTKQSLPCQLSDMEQTFSALSLGLHDYTRKTKTTGVVIGLSGGVDSAVTLAIAVNALGADNVTAIIMPSPYTAQMSIDDAIFEADALGVAYHIIPINHLYQDYLETLSPHFDDHPLDATEENIQARIRGMLLMAFANKFRKMVVTTGNKSELSVGYATLYGDMAGGYAAIKDLFKTDVYALANYINSMNPVIPERVITRAPSAELAPDQKDADTLPNYDTLDAILKRYIEQDESPEVIIQAGFDQNTVLRVVKMVDQNEHKRRQAPLGTRLSTRAFGKDRRYPIASGHLNYLDDTCH